MHEAQYLPIVDNELFLIIRPAIMTLDVTTVEENTTAVFQLKGSLFTLTVLQLIEANYETFAAQLEAMAVQAPKFFHNTPIVIDLQRLADPSQPIDLNRLLQVLRQHSLIPIGLRGGLPEHQMAALSIGLAILPETKSEPTQAVAKTQNSASTPRTVTIPQTSKVVTQQVRSGQQIYAKGGDLIILAPVSPGAELLADGNIHVYGPLRGRALAGISGDQNARIFCQSLEAELVSIAGHYWIKEDLKNVNEQQVVQIYLEEERLKFHYFA